MQTRRINDEVLVACDPIVRVTCQDIDVIKQLASKTPRRRSRLCAHRSSDDLLHEMLILLDRATYVRPHKHQNKSESFHVMEGTLDVVIFNDGGTIIDVIPMGDYASGRVFFYRLADPYFHTVMPRSEIAIIHETTNGPFHRADTEFADFAPLESDADAARVYVEKLRKDVSHFQAG